MEGKDTDCRRGGGVAASVKWLAAEYGLKLRGDPGPRAHILRLLLAPNQFRVRVALGDLVQAIGMERIELLNPNQGGVSNPVLVAMLAKVVIDLAGAKDQAAGFGSGGITGGIVENFAKDAIRKLAQG